MRTINMMRYVRDKENLDVFLTVYEERVSCSTISSHKTTIVVGHCMTMHPPSVANNAKCRKQIDLSDINYLCGTSSSRWLIDLRDLIASAHNSVTLTILNDDGILVLGM